MLLKFKQIFALTVVVCLLVYLSIMLYVLTSWHLDDSLAFKLSNFGWFKLAVNRFYSGVLVTLIFGLFEYLFLRLLLGWQSKPFFVNHMVIISMIWLTLWSLGLSINFFIQKPWF